MPELNDVIDDKNKTASEKPEKKPVPEKKKKEVVTTATTIEKKPKKDVDETKVEYKRPPMEQIVTDFESHLLTLTIDNKPLTKLGYKCGKIIFGLKSETGKDFRVIAFKARKKSKSVNGKSRCIFYFGIDKTLDQKFLATSASKFGKCSVQSKSPVEFILDKKSFTELFEKNDSKVLDVLKKLATITVAEKSKQYIEKKKKADKEAKEKTEA